MPPESDVSPPWRRRLSHDFIVCTRNRPTDVVSALNSIAAQTRLPASVIVVDASDGDQTMHAVDNFVRDRCKGIMAVRCLRASPGLPAQRNLGVRYSQADVVHFIDDDVVLDQDYLLCLADVFESDNANSIVGAGGLISNDEQRRPRLWWRLACLDSRRNGVILRSGINVMVVGSETRLDVQWLSGCSMSYRRHTASVTGFDEGLAGYALMEDADFGFRAKKSGRLVLEPRARLDHNVSPVERWGHSERHRASTYRRGWFVEKNFPFSARLVFWWSVVAGAIIQTIVSLLTGNWWGLRVMLWRLQGALDFIRGRR